MTLRCLITGILLIFIISSCAQKQSAPPALSYSRDLVKGPKYYVVKKGDTLFSIGYRSGFGYKRIAVWNSISPPYNIHIGQTIKLFDSNKKLKKHNNTPSNNTALLKKRGSSQKRFTNSNTITSESSLNWQWPIKGKIVKTFSQTGNKGIDIGANPGWLVKAAAAGKVVYSGQGLIGYGNLVIIKHNEYYLSAYANNSQIRVKEGQYVKRGQEIAVVGKGLGNNSALHFEIRKYGKPVNPMYYLPNK